MKDENIAFDGIDQELMNELLQEFDLCKALDENEKLIEKRLGKQTPGEIKVTQEIDKLTKRLNQLNSELDKVRPRILLIKDVQKW